jgi:hypothetical protein
MLFVIPAVLVMLGFFAVAQGAAVFGTAYLGLRILRTSHWFGKAVAISVSYAAWVALTITGYALLRGDFGLMDGFGFVLFLCFTALISSAGYWLAWTCWPLARGLWTGRWAS